DGTFEPAIRQGVDSDRRGLARPQSRDLRLLEIRVDIYLVERNQTCEPLPRLHVIAALHCAVADDAVERSADHCERQIPLGFGKRRLELLEGARRLLALTL